MHQVRVAILVVGSIAAGIAFSVVAWAGNELSASSLTRMLVFALPLAGIYALSASGLVVVYTTTGVFNFAQGAIGMFFAFVYWQLSAQWGLPAGVALVLCVFVLAPLFGFALDAAIMRRVQGQSLVVQLMITVGLMFALIGLANLIWDPTAPRTVPPLFGLGEGVSISGVLLTWHRVFTIFAAVALAVGLRILLYRTRLGIAMRAVVDNRGLAALSGARPAFLSGFAWGLGCGVAALAGILLAPEVGSMAASGPLTLLVITAFAAAVVGRLRSLPLTYLGALILALALGWSRNFLSFSGRWTNLPETLPAIMLFIALLVIPRAGLQFARTSTVRKHERVSSVRDTALGMGLLFVLMGVASAFLSPTNTSRFAIGMGTALVALSLVPLIGWAGQVSLAPLAFAGIGAAAYARFGGAEGQWYAVILAALVCIPIGALLALPAMRLQGLYLALATMAFALVVELTFFVQPFAIGQGSRVVVPLRIGGFDFSSERSLLMLFTGVFGVCAVGVVALRRSAFGRRLVALKDSEAAAATVGINVFETKLAVFALSAGMAGFAGAFLAMEYRTIDPGATNFKMLAGLTIVLALVIGGVACVSGALFAGMFALTLVLIEENWHLTLWQGLTFLAPGLAAFGIINNPSGAVVAIGEAFAPYIPWRSDARLEAAELKEAMAESEVGELGLTRPFDEADVLLVDRALGVSNDLPRPTVGSA